MNELIKQIRKEIYPLLNEIVVALGGDPISYRRKPTAGGLALLKFTRKELLAHVAYIKDLAIAKQATPPVTTPARAKRAPTTKKAESDGDPIAS